MRLQSASLLLVLLLSGCSIFSPVPANNQTAYQISNVPPVAHQKTHALTLMVLNPDANNIYSSTDMAYTTTPYTVAYFSKSRWAEPPAKMLQQIVIQALQNSKYYRAIVTPAFSGSYDYALSMQLIELKQDFTLTTSVIRMKVNVQLISATNARIISAKQFSVVVPARYNTPYGGVLAANEAAKIIAADIVRFSERK